MWVLGIWDSLEEQTVFNLCVISLTSPRFLLVSHLSLLFSTVCNMQVFFFSPPLQTGSLSVALAVLELALASNLEFHPGLSTECWDLMVCTSHYTWLIYCVCVHARVKIYSNLI